MTDTTPLPVAPDARIREIVREEIAPLKAEIDRLTGRQTVWGEPIVATDSPILPTMAGD